MLLCSLLSMLLSACSVPCESAVPGAARDACFHERVTLAPARWTPTELVRFATEIQDPIVRGATVQVWVRAHRGAVDEADRAQVCGLLDGVERSACERRLAAAHLNR